MIGVAMTLALFKDIAQLDMMQSCASKAARQVRPCVKH